MSSYNYFAVKSFVEITRYLTDLPDTTGPYFLSERISQDPLENYFSRVRARGGRCENPTAKDCLQSAQSLRVQGSFAMQPIRAIVAGKSVCFQVDVRLIVLHFPRDQGAQRNNN